MTSQKKTFVIPKEDFPDFLEKVIATEQFIVDNTAKQSRMNVHGIPITGIELYKIIDLEQEFEIILNNKTLCKELGIKPIYDLYPRELNRIEIQFNTVELLIRYINSLEYFRQVIDLSNDGQIKLCFGEDNFVVTR